MEMKNGDEMLMLAEITRQEMNLLQEMGLVESEGKTEDFGSLPAKQRDTD